MPSFRRNALRNVSFTLFLCFLSSRSFADSSVTTKRTITKLAEGVYEIRHPDAPDTFPQGNTTVIIGERSVLVVDSCLLPSSAREDVDQIRTWTNKPVSFLVNTHWHFDHTLGNGTYAAAFPAIQIIAHQATWKTIADFNQGAVVRYPKRADRFKKILETGKNADGKPLSDNERKDYEHALAGLGPVVAEFNGVKQVNPNVIFDHELDIDLGNRPVEIKFLGRGNTAGDTVIYLPNEKILMTGDLMDHPVPYLFGGFPVDFVNTLHALKEIDAQTLVPGHGDVLHDKLYVQQVIDFLSAVNQEVEKEIDDGLSLEEVQQALPKTFAVNTWREKFVGHDQEDSDFFDTSFAGLIKASYNQIKAR